MRTSVEEVQLCVPVGPVQETTLSKKKNIGRLADRYDFPLVNGSVRLSYFMFIFPRFKKRGGKAWSDSKLGTRATAW